MRKSLRARRCPRRSRTTGRCKTMRSKTMRSRRTMKRRVYPRMRGSSTPRR
jgi:hypothetical protein